jgi:hypothetical protein
MTTYPGGLVGAGNNSGGTDTEVQLWGLYHLTGTTVSVYIDGWDCGDFTVATDGSVTVPLFGTTLGGVVGEAVLATLISDNGDYGEQTTPLVLHNATVTHNTSVPIVIGAPFVAQGQRVRGDLPADVGTERETSLGISRRTHFFAMLVKNGVNVNVGTSLTPSPAGDMILCQFADPGTRLPVQTGFDGVWRETFDDPGAENYDSMLCWQADRPYPFTLMSVSQFTAASEQ